MLNLVQEQEQEQLDYAMHWRGGTAEARWSSAVWGMEYFELFTFG